MTLRPPAECPVCGGYSLQQDESEAALLAVCDVLVVKALETLGKWLVRQVRSRFKVLDGRPYYIAHTIWQPEDALVDKALKGAWEVVPLIVTRWGEVTPGQVTSMLDGYVHDLAITGTEHSMEELAYRFTSRLGLPVYVRGEDHG